MEPRSITVVGGLGGMGNFMARELTQAGCRVEVVDRKNGPPDWAAVARTDVIILAVPMPALDELLDQLGPLTRPDGAVIDICSLKAQPLASMLERCRGEVIGTHPLCGPATDSLRDQVVYLTPGRPGPWECWFRSFLRDRGARVVEIEPGEHDRLMARIQVLRHLLLFTFGLSLARLDFDLPELLPISGPWFSQLVEMLTHQAGQAPGLYADMALDNPESQSVWNEFVKAASQVSATLASRDRAAVLGLIDEVSTYLRPL